MTNEQIKRDISQVMDNYLELVDFPTGGLFVVGCSTSMIQGEWMSTGSSLEVGQAVFETLNDYAQANHFDLAIQGCEHINRALLMEKRTMDRHHFDQVEVVPAMHAGGATQVAAYQEMSEPVEVEHIVADGGIDIGGTEIGMHVRFVQVPVHLTTHQIGAANVVALKTRPKLIGGARAQYDFTEANLRS
ncbi:TIGR01440 family protein [Levilactobacillus bambusae]|uniref:UPF0340 protein DCM90_04105 n=1 Tax=Levilactobacillus bambusae TaxID=2024736 RepID=A0A2V1N175_9LACO|nr:TIGR01440 family protein [Levilactobacillus bambusae]